MLNAPIKAIIQQGDAQIGLIEVSRLEVDHFDELRKEQPDSENGLSGAVFGRVKSALFLTEPGLVWEELVLGVPPGELELVGQAAVRGKSGQGIGSSPLRLQARKGWSNQPSGGSPVITAASEFSERSQSSLIELRDRWNTWSGRLRVENREVLDQRQGFLSEGPLNWNCSLEECLANGLSGVLLLANRRKPVAKEVLEVALEELGYLSLKSQQRDFGDESAVDWSSSTAWVEEPGRLYLNVMGRESDGFVAPSEFERARSTLNHGLLLWARENSEVVPGLQCLRPEGVFGSISGRVPDLWVTQGPMDHGVDSAGRQFMPEAAGNFCFIPNLKLRPRGGAGDEERIEQTGLRVLAESLPVHQLIDFLTGHNWAGGESENNVTPPAQPIRGRSTANDEDKAGENLINERLRALGYLE